MYALWLLALSSIVSAQQSLLLALAAQSSLSTFTAFLQDHESLITASKGGNLPGTLNSNVHHKDVTANKRSPAPVLAPSNAAFQSFANGSSPSTNFTSFDQIEALLSYHFLKGVYSQATFRTSPTFIPTLLSNTSYTNVTTGQVVEAIASQDGIEFKSAVNHVSKLVDSGSDIVFQGGFIQIVDNVLVCQPVPAMRNLTRPSPSAHDVRPDTTIRRLRNHHESAIALFPRPCWRILDREFRLQHHTRDDIDRSGCNLLCRQRSFG